MFFYLGLEIMILCQHPQSSVKLLVIPCGKSYNQLLVIITTPSQTYNIHSLKYFVDTLSQHILYYLFKFPFFPMLFDLTLLQLHN